MKTNRGGRPALRSKEYWLVYLRLKQRECRAKKNNLPKELAETRKLLTMLKAGVPLPALHGALRRRTVPLRKSPQPPLHSWT